MEAASVPDGADAPDQQDEGQQTPAPEQSAQPEWLGRLEGRLDQLDTSLASLTPAEQEQGFEDQYDEPGFYDPQTGEYIGEEQGQDDELDFDRLVNDRVQQQVQEALKPFLQQQEEQRLNTETATLEEQYPELRDHDTAEAVVSQAEQLAQSLGMPQLGGTPGFVELVYKAGKADERAASETPTGTREEVELEEGTGAAPSIHENDSAMAIVRAGRSSLFG